MAPPMWIGGSFTMQLTQRAPADTFHLGQGYWMRVPSGGMNWTQVGTAAPASAPYTIQLSTGWNMIGNPFAYSVSLSSIKFTPTSGSGATFDTAASEGLILPWIYTWAAGATSYATLSSGANLTPYSGYWIFANQPLTMSIPSS